MILVELGSEMLYLCKKFNDLSGGQSMKLVIMALLACCFSSLTYSSTVIEGIVDNCESKVDVYTYRFGSYQADVKLVEVSSEQVKFNLDLKFLVCKEISKGVFERVPANPMADVSYQLPMGHEQYINVMAKPQSLSLKFMKDGAYKLIKTINLESKASKQSVVTSLSLSDILNPSETEELSRNRVVKTHFSFFLVKNIIWTSDLHEDTRENLVYSAFRKILEVRLDDNDVVVAKLLK